MNTLTSAAGSNETSARGALFRGRCTSVLVRRVVAVAMSAVVLTGTMSFTSPSPATGETTTDNADALQARVRDELSVFTNWLRTNGVKGYIGEAGWPNNVDTEKWNALARKWYTDAAASGVWTSSWATGEWWGTTYKLSSYVWSQDDGALGTPRPPAAVIEEQMSADRRGVNVAGGEFGPIGYGLMPTSTLSNVNPGLYGRDYYYDRQASFNYLASRGLTTVRLPFRWERIQPTLGGPLDPAELQRLTDAVGRVRAAGMSAVLDVHNYAAYWMFDGNQGVRHALGSAQLTESHFSDLWRRLSVAFEGNSGVVAYGLMNEPVGMSPANGFTAAQVWERASQAALNAIRANGDTKLVMVPGYQWSGVKQWATQHPKSWITDSAGNYRYEAHHYWDRDSSGAYARSYSDEVADAEAKGYRASTATSTTTTSTTTTSTTTTSTTVPPAVIDTLAPTAPVGLVATGGKRRIDLSWRGSTDAGGSGMAAYEVFRSSSPIGSYTRVASTTGTTYRDSSLRRGATYYYYVRATDGAGNASLNSIVVSAQVR